MAGFVYIQGQPVNADSPYDPYSSSQQLSSLYSGLLSEQKELNDLQMAREDSAYQRAVADMKAAGLNPWLAVSGNGASAAPLASPKKTALDGLLSYLEYDLNSRNKSINSATSIINAIARVIGVIGLAASA